MITDVAVPLARAGRALIVDPVVGWELSEAHPAAWIELNRCRYLSNLFCPEWGVLFEESEFK